VTDLIETAPEEALEPQSGTRALVRLVAGLAVIVGLFVVLGWVNLLLVIAALILMVLLHELGHFATAKWSGMKVTEFFVGFGPRLWSVRRGETEYGVKAIPGGGYCKIIGMTSLDEIHPSDEPRAYRNQAFWKRIVVASAGSTMHFLLAFVLAFSALFFLGRPDSSIVKVQGYLHLDGGTSTPAQQGGIAPGDQIVAVNGKKVTSDTSLSGPIHASAGKPVTVTVERSGKTLDLTVVPLDGRTAKISGSTLAPVNGPSVGYLGVSLTPGTSTEGLWASLSGSAGIVRTATVGAVTALGHLFSPHGLSNYAHQVVSPPPSNTPSASAGSSSQAPSQAQDRPESIIGAVRTASQAAQAGSLTLIEVFISINIFIGLVNMLPMLPLDGGHVLIAAYEWIRTRRGRPMYRADVTKLMPVVYAFVGFLLLLVTTSMYLDLTHPAANPFR